MTSVPSDIAFTPTVKAIQSAKGSRESYARMEQRGGWKTRVTEQLSSFIAERDMFYLGTANAKGQPYIQYRGGPQGFLKVLDDRTLAFADFAGNQQYITIGNLAENAQAFIFLMDYANRKRMKLWGRARVVENDHSLLEKLQDEQYPARVERAIVFEIEAWDVNCPQHIHVRYAENKITPVVEALQARIEELESTLRTLTKTKPE